MAKRITGMVVANGAFLKKIREGKLTHDRSYAPLAFRKRAGIGIDTLYHIEAGEPIEEPSYRSYCRELGVDGDDYLVRRMDVPVGELMVETPTVLNFRPSKWPAPSNDRFRASELCIIVAPFRVSSYLNDGERAIITGARLFSRTFDEVFREPFSASYWVALDGIPRASEEMTDAEWRGETAIGGGSTFHSANLVARDMIDRELLFRSTRAPSWSDFLSMLEDDWSGPARFELAIAYRVDDRASEKRIRFNVSSRCLAHRARVELASPYGSAVFLQPAVIGGAFDRCGPDCCAFGSAAESAG